MNLNRALGKSLLSLLTFTQIFPVLGQTISSDSRFTVVDGNGMVPFSKYKVPNKCEKIEGSYSIEMGRAEMKLSIARVGDGLDRPKNQIIENDEAPAPK